MKRDTRPESPRTRILDVPPEPTMDRMRGDALRDRLVLDAELLETTFQRPLGAALARGIAASLDDNQIVTDHPFEQAAYLWSVLEDAEKDPRACASLMINAAAATLRIDPLLHDMLAGIAAAIDGCTRPPQDASGAWRMGHKAAQECFSKRPVHTVAQAAEPEIVPPELEPVRSDQRMTSFAFNNPLGSARHRHAHARPLPPMPPPPPISDEEEQTRPHAAATTGPEAEAEPEPPPLLEPSTLARPREPDACEPRRGGASPVRDDALTSLHHVHPRTEALRRR